MPGLLKGLGRGALAGAAGVTALNAATYGDMFVRGRGASDVPSQMVEKLAQDAGTDIPGSGEERDNRYEASGPLAGILAGVGVGAVSGALHSTGLKLPAFLGAPLMGLAAMAAADVPLFLTKVSDPRSWAAKDWLSDAAFHLAYGVVAHAALTSMEQHDLAALKAAR
ncbi:hypothetical protein ACXR2U_10985 [Jatrophihabitans sp. YIM 134969]